MAGEEYAFYTAPSRFQQMAAFLPASPDSKPFRSGPQGFDSLGVFASGVVHAKGTAGVWGVQASLRMLNRVPDFCVRFRAGMFL